MSEEYMNPNLEKNRYIYNITRGGDYNLPGGIWVHGFINVHKYPIIYSNKEMTYYKVPGSTTLCSISNLYILDDLDKVTNALAKNTRYCNIYCLEDPGHSYLDKQTLLSVARKKEDLVKELEKLNLMKDNVEDKIKSNNREREELIRKIDLAEKTLKQISETGETDVLSDQV